MRKQVFGAGVLSLLALGSVAEAADPQIETGTSGFNWSGVYVGFGGGFGAAVHELNAPLAGPLFTFNGIGGEGFFGDVTLGYDRMVSERMLLGAFVSGRFGNIGSNVSVSFLPLDLDLLTAKYGFDVGARAGFLMTPNTLGYVTGGYTWQKFDLISDFGLDIDWGSHGYFIGAGMETVVAGNWTLKTEYRYSAYAEEDVLADFGIPGLLGVSPSTHTIHIGANYRFGGSAGGGATFEPAAYDWNGLTVGVAGGAGAVVHELQSNAIGGLSFNGIGGEGVFGEISVGYDRTFASDWVAGVMVGARYSNIATTLAIAPIAELSIDADYGFDVLARVGKKVSDSTLVYALGGYSWQHFDINVATIGFNDSIYDWGASGFSVGGGIESALSDRATVNIEYRYSDYAAEDFSDALGIPPGSLEAASSMHTVRAGFKYKLF